VRKTITNKKTKTQDNVVTKYHANGKTIWSIGTIIHGEPEGYWKWFRLDGTIKRSGYFIQGKPTGTWVTYNIQGKPYKTTVKKI
jgi:antitoxin component YwqK of YwqJK toxin-antitoxin module